MQWSKTLTVAEAGVNDMVARLGESRSATSPCPIDDPIMTRRARAVGANTRRSGRRSGKTVDRDVDRLLPARAAPKFTREVQVTYRAGPGLQVRAVLGQLDTIMNGMEMYGDVYSNGDITVGTSAVVCGSVLSGGGDISLQNGSQV